MEHNSFLKEEINPSMDQQDTCCEHQWRIDVEKIVSESGSRQRRESSSVCIFRVPKFLIDMNPKAYIPQVVSLGPLHWKTLSTQMLDHKAEAVCKMLGSLQGRDINFLVEEISKLDEEIRSCYDEVIKCDKKTLALMMTLDGCLLLEFCRTIICNAKPSQTVNFEPISIFAGNKIEFLRGYMVLRDIMMLENQIPLCVLVKLLQLKLKSSEEYARQALCNLAYTCLMSKASPFKFPHHTETLKNLEAELIKPQELMEKSNTLLDFWRLCMESFLTAGQTRDCSLPAGLDADDGRRRTGPLQDVTHKAPVLDPRTNQATPEQLTVRPSLGGPRFFVLCSTCILRCPVPCADLDNRIPCCPVACAALDYPSSEVWSGKEGMSEYACGFEEVKGAALDNSIPGPSGEFEMLQLEPPPHEPVTGAALDYPIPVVKGAALDYPSSEVWSGKEGMSEYAWDFGEVKGAAIDNSIPGPSREFAMVQLDPTPHEPVMGAALDNAIASILPARSLKIAGIEIKACKRDKLNEIRFINKGLCGATFLLPKLLVTDTTEIVIRNLLALEECRASPQNPISRYIQLMDMLIDGREDVSLLIKNGVIDNYLGSDEEIAALFNSLCKGISVKHSPKFDHVLKQVKDYHNGKWNVVIAEFVQKHFSSPCVKLAFVASVLIVVMTGVQTFYSVYSAYNK